MEKFNSMPTILIIDDDLTMRKTLHTILSNDGYDITLASNGEEGLSKAAKVSPDVILLDILMPGMDGFEVCKQARNDPLLREVPILIISGLDDRESLIQGLEAGADDYIFKPVDGAELRARIKTIVRLNRYRLLQDERNWAETLIQLSPDGMITLTRDGSMTQANPKALAMLNCTSLDKIIGKPLGDFITNDDLEVFYQTHSSLMDQGASSQPVTLDTAFEQTSHIPLPVELHITPFKMKNKDYIQVVVRDSSDRKLVEDQLQNAFDTIQLSIDETISAWGKALEIRDFVTQGHIQHIIDLTVKTARSLGFDEERILHLRRGAALHDIGKIGIPDGILLKPGTLSPEEWAIMRKHPIYAYEILSSVFFLLPSTLIPLYHHERWDGSGYPQGLKGEDIPIEARIFAVVDVWESLSSDRPFRLAWKEDKVRAYLQQQAGILFDPHIVDVFLNQVVKTESPSDHDNQPI